MTQQAARKTAATAQQAAAITVFVADLRASADIWVSDLGLARRLQQRQLRGGRLTAKDTRDLSGDAVVPVLAIAYDEIGNIFALGRDCRRRQYIGR